MAWGAPGLLVGWGFRGWLGPTSCFGDRPPAVPYRPLKVLRTGVIGSTLSIFICNHLPSSARRKDRFA